ncbi:hypothetical protein LR48_Vigan03g187900 [Vigna angularis]|uniref:Uncharacterized protein n=1 Tax=Phaseolus angularis TaxID=3914 RepID=A0A0L9U761_PHAAN|nr:hypothetical protein LR48_Vigan03g187900 [Vigna angularis]
MTHFQHPNTSPYFAFTEPKRGSLFSKREKWRRWRCGWRWFWWRELSPARPRGVLVEATVAGYGRGGGELVVPSRRPWVSREGVSWGVGNEDEPPKPLGEFQVRNYPCGPSPEMSVRSGTLGLFWNARYLASVRHLPTTNARYLASVRHLPTTNARYLASVRHLPTTNARYPNKRALVKLKTFRPFAQHSP